MRVCLARSLNPFVLLRRLVARIIVARSPRMECGSILVVDLVADDGSPSRIHRVKEAVDLLLVHFPRGYSLAQRYLSRILIIGGGGQAYSAPLRACLLDVAFVERQNLPAIAGLICHEAMHARIDRAGISYARLNRLRIERLCVHVQAEALDAMGEAPAAQRARQALGQPWWTDDDRVARRAEQLHSHGVPRSLVRLDSFAHRILAHLGRR